MPSLNRRTFLKLSGGLGAGLLMRPGIGIAATPDRKPNFIIIFIDDQGYQDLGVFGSPNIKTPRIDQMAGEGMRFTDF